MATNNNLNVKGGMDEIVFEGRNKEYGAYYLRKKYNKYIMVAFAIAFVIIASAVITPLIASYYNRDKNNKKLQKTVLAEMDKMTKDEPPPPPPPPPPPEAMAAVVKFKAPVVVDSTVKEAPMQFAQDLDDNKLQAPPSMDYTDNQPKDKVIEPEEKIFISVEENATFQGGDVNLFRGWVQEHMKYPESAAEMGLEGKVIIQFVVNSHGAIEGAKVLRGVDPALDQEATRAILSSPKWIPGKQGGKAVKQQFVIPINFKLQK